MHLAVTTSLVSHNFPLQCARTAHQNAYNYATTFNGICHGNTRTALYQARHIDTDCDFDYKCQLATSLYET